MFTKENLTWLPGVSTIMANAEGKKAIDVTLLVTDLNGESQEVTVKAPKDWSHVTFWQSFAKACMTIGLSVKKIHVQRAVISEVE